MQIGNCMRHVVTIAVLAFSLPSLAEYSLPHSSSSHSKHYSNYCSNCERDNNGHIKRSAEAKREFRKSHPCPSTGKVSGACAGYVIDHITPLKRGGADNPANMQWQTAEDARLKDRYE